MSAARIPGIRKTVRQFAVAIAACTAVAGGAALVAAPDDTAPTAPSAVADGQDNGWPVPPPSPAPTVD
ncbi:hypothetical protein ACIPPS_27520 [Streptomyces sp. NPDC090127]|uniref:hypothetical protein n=1 Tax=Streptomyces sp. NPDC090127 TaxID=3365953 RepID=UPI0038272286